ncbi:Aste57867_17194 [Aphanomyces stellatus]|uniref:Aste57867_17194 protein n=1 Tax=Aphanomyces stellatus TaxID=120398 RepID=A0A485L8W5_9STRA|nr:hypothetical protein As57867_017135 [Aphanomyces stellatus]VFT93951.1 Aste57867_17194 [Aphanomyces stellatus]
MATPTIRPSKTPSLVFGQQGPTTSPFGPTTSKPKAPFESFNNGPFGPATPNPFTSPIPTTKSIPGNTQAPWTGSFVQPQQPSWSKSVVPPPIQASTTNTSSGNPFVPTVAAAASTASSPHKAFYCNQCSQLITGRIRYKCLVCTDFDLCETCEGVESTHPTHHPFLRLKHAHYGDKNYVTLNRQELTHHGVHCCECNQPIVGILYQCTLCPTVRLCESCELVAGHADFTHPLLKIFRSQKLSTKTS